MPTISGAAASSSATGSIPTAPPDAPVEAQADPDVVATAYLARSAEVVAVAATLVGDHGDWPTGTRGLAERVRGAFAREYVTGGGRVLSDAATVYALALEWSLLPTEEQRRRAGRAAGGPRAHRRLSDQHRLPRHAAWSRTR